MNLQSNRKIKHLEQQYTALYGRLSSDDDLEGDSNSIKNQKLTQLFDLSKKQETHLHFSSDYGGGFDLAHSGRFAANHPFCHKPERTFFATPAHNRRHKDEKRTQRESGRNQVGRRTDRKTRQDHREPLRG